MERATLKLGSRGSLLAKMQASQVMAMLEPHLAGRSIELVIITTSGDQQTDTQLIDSGGKGLFIKEIETELLSGRIDLAVHSAKDMPVEIPAGLTIAATPSRYPPNDVWIGHDGRNIADLKPDSIVGTSSLRRAVQLLSRRSDLRIVPLRGNIDTRLKKVRQGEVAGTFLAQAGLLRASMFPPDAIILPCDEFIPAAAQGTLAIQTRTDDTVVGNILKHIHDPSTFATLEFERRMIQSLAGNCLAPIGVCAQQRETLAGVPQPGWIVRALIATPNAAQIARGTLLTEDPSISGLHALFNPLLEVLSRRGSSDIMARIKLKSPESQTP